MSDEQLDAQVAFYLEYEKHIREWVKLEYSARTAFDSFMASLRPHVEVLAGALGQEVMVTDPADDGWAPYGVVGLFSPTWLRGGETRPVVTVALAWHRGKATFRGLTGYDPFCTVWVRTSVDAGALARELQPILRAAAPELNGKAQDPRWVAWRAENPDQERFWEDLPAYRQQLLRRLQRTWEATSGVIEESVRASGPYGAGQQAPTP